MYKNTTNYLIFTILIFSSITFGQSANELIPQNEPFFIQSAINYHKNPGGFWDIPGGEENIREKAPIKVWELSDKKQDRRYVISPSSKSGYVHIQIDGVAGYIDVEGGKNNNGTPIQIYKPNNSSSQNFKFSYVGNGRFKIFNENGKVITLANRSSQNGSQVQMWDDQNGDWTEWCLISTKTNKTLTLENKITTQGEDMSGIGTFYVQSAISYGKDSKGFWDVPGTANAVNGSNIQAYSLSDLLPDRQFNLIKSSSNLSYYQIAISNNNNMLLSVQADKTDNGTNVCAWEKNDSPAKNFYFKHLGGGRFKIYNQNGKIITLANRSDDDGSNVLMWDDQDGEWAEWYLIDVNTNLPFNPSEQGVAGIQDMRVMNVSCTNEQQLIDNIDATYQKVLSVEGKTMQVNDKVKDANSTIGTAYSLTNNFAKLNDDVNSTHAAISAFTNIPVIGTAVTVLSTSLNLAKKQLNGANTALSAIKGPVINQANVNIFSSKKSMVGFTSSINKLKSDLFALKGKLIQSQNKTGSDALFAQLNSKLTEISAALDNADKNLVEMEKTSKSVDKLKGPVSKVDGGVKNFEKAFRQTDKVADEINDVLGKRFKKEVMKVKINISLRDVLEGGKVGKVFKKYASDWAEKLMKPIINKLNIKIPTVPGVDEFKNGLNETADLTKKMKQNSDELELLIQQFNKSNSEIKIAGGTLS